MNFIIHVEFDREHNRYFVHESDIPGLVVEASSVDEVIEIVRDAAPDLLGAQALDATFDFRLQLPVAA
jgi:hypothetical protein